MGLLSKALTVFLRTLLALKGRRTQRQGLSGGQIGAVSFIRFFGSALQVIYDRVHAPADLQGAGKRG